MDNIVLFLIKSKYIKVNNPKHITTGHFQEVQKFALKNQKSVVLTQRCA